MSKLKSKKLNVVSVFDGMSCAQESILRAGFSVENYYASEIDKYAIQVTMKNFPNTIQLGSVTEWRSWNIDWSSIDLLCGGSPCQGFSFAGKQLNFEDPRSKLFFVYVDILNHIKSLNPNIKFLLENVKMKKEFQNVISEQLGVEPIEINSALVSAQNRKRLYWANWDFGQPEDRGIFLKDIVHENCFIDRDKSRAIIGSIGRTTAREYFDKNQGQVAFDIGSSCQVPTFNVNPSGKGMNGHVYPISNEKSTTLTTNKGEGQKIAIDLAEYIVPFDKTLQILDKEVERGKVGYFRKDSQANRVYYIHDKAVTLCGDAGGGAAKMGQYLFGHVQTARGKNEGGITQKDKSPTMTSCKWEHNNHLLFGCFAPGQTELPKNNRFDDGDKSHTLTSQGKHGILFGCITPDRVEKRQNGQRFSEGKKFYTLTAQDRHGILVEGYIRKLTPVECERLQTLPDNYTAFGLNPKAILDLAIKSAENSKKEMSIADRFIKISNSQRYKMLGNGWTCEVIAHIFKNLT